MRRKNTGWLGIALMAFAMSASAFIPEFQPLETFFPDSVKTDELGNTLALTDQTGALIGQAFYSPYGDTWAQSGSLPTPYRFGGIYGVSTEENGLAYMQNRYYDFRMKRFINPDPTGLKGGVNFYTYVDGNPLNAIDPEGLCARPSLFGRTSLFGGSTYSSMRSYSPSWLKPMQNDLRSLQRYGTSFEDRLRGTMTPAVAAASVFNPAAIGRGIANEYWGNYKASGSHYNAANLTFNPVVREFLNASQATVGIGYKYHNSGSRLSTGQRFSAGLSGGLSVGLWSAGAAGGIGRGLSYIDDVARSSLSYADDAARVSSRSLAAAQAPSLSSTKALTYDPAKVAHQGGVLRSFTSQSDEFFYRVYSGNNIRGAFLTKVKPRSAAWAKEALALPPGNNADFIQRVTVPRGTVLQRSRALPNRWGRGGAEQFELLKQNGKYPHLHFEEGVPFK